MKAFLLLTAVTAAMLRSCEEECRQGSKRLHRPNKIDSVAVRADDHDSLKVWDVVAFTRDEKRWRIRTVAIREFMDFDSAALLTCTDYARKVDSLGVKRIASSA